MAREPVAGMMDRNVPSQLDEEDLRAELEIELPDSQNVVEANIVGENGSCMINGLLKVSYIRSCKVLQKTPQMRLKALCQGIADN